MGFKVKSKAIVARMHEKGLAVKSLVRITGIGPRTIQRMIGIKPYSASETSIHLVSEALGLTREEIIDTTTKPVRSSHAAPVCDAIANSNSLTDGVEYIRLKDRLKARGIGPDPALFDAKLLDMIDAPLIIGEAVLERDVADFKGVDIANLIVRPGRAIDVALPQYARSAREQIPEPPSNRPIAFLTEWHNPLFNLKSVPTLGVCRSD